MAVSVRCWGLALLLSLAARLANASRNSTNAFAANATGGGGGLVSYGNTTVAGVSVDYVRSMIGFTFGPLVMLYGNDLRAVVAALNAAYACGLDRMLNVVRKIRNIAMLDTELPLAIYGTVVAAASMTSVSLQGGTGDLMLKIGIISGMMQQKAVTLMQQHQHRLPLGWIISINSGLSSGIGFVTTALASSALPASIAAGIIAVNNGVGAPFVAAISQKIEDEKLDCVVREDKELPSACLTERWLKFLVLYVPTLVPITVAVIVRRMREKAANIARMVRAAKDAEMKAAGKEVEHIKHAGGGKKKKSAIIEKVNAAVMAGTLLTAAAAGSCVHLLQARGMNTPSFLMCVQGFVVSCSMLVQWQLEKFELDGPQHVIPLMRMPIRGIVTIKETVLKPMIWLNYKILTVAGQEAAKPAAAAAAAKGVVAGAGKAPENPVSGGGGDGDSLPRTRSISGGIEAIRHLPRTISHAGMDAIGKLRTAFSNGGEAMVQAEEPKPQTSMVI